MSKLFGAILALGLAVNVLGQTEVLSNSSIVEMTEAGLSTEIIAAKIESTQNRFETSTQALIALKKAGVDDVIISLMMERAESQLPGVPPRDTETRLADEKAAEEAQPGSSTALLDPKEALARAKTIAFHKSSLNPSRQNLEKALLKNPDFKARNLTILRYKEEADLFVEIGYVSGSWITHRYVYRIFDRRSGAVLAAGETTSWGSLAENLAKHISRSLKVLAGS